MGSGKSTVGKKLAAKLNLNFVDLDDLIENKYKISIPQLFQKYNEEAFRVIERECLFSTFENESTVISAGGGTPCFFDNMDQINNIGISVYLKLHPKSLCNRLVNARKKRPLLNDKSSEEILHYIENHLKLREPFYEKASITVKGENIDVEDLILQINSLLVE